MARSALSRGRAEDALDALRKHRARFSSSHLAEEREALTILALIAKGSLDDASARADHFRARYPDSLLRTVVEEGIKKAGRPK